MGRIKKIGYESFFIINIDCSFFLFIFSVCGKAGRENECIVLNGR